jgi:hypothetical protein
MLKLVIAGSARLSQSNSTDGSSISGSTKWNISRTQLVTSAGRLGFFRWLTDEAIAQPVKAPAMEKIAVTTNTRR